MMFKIEFQGVCICVYMFHSVYYLLITANAQEVFAHLVNLTSKNPSAHNPTMISHNASKSLYIFSVLQFGFSDSSFSQS